MKFIDVIRLILRERSNGMTPQEIRDQIKAEYPDRYGTEAHLRNVDKGHYNNRDVEQFRVRLDAGFTNGKTLRALDSIGYRLSGTVKEQQRPAVQVHTGSALSQNAHLGVHRRRHGSGDPAQ